MWWRRYGKSREIHFIRRFSCGRVLRGREGVSKKWFDKIRECILYDSVITHQSTGVIEAERFSSSLGCSCSIKIFFCTTRCHFIPFHPLSLSLSVAFSHWNWLRKDMLHGCSSRCCCCKTANRDYITVYSFTFRFFSFVFLSTVSICCSLC